METLLVGTLKIDEPIPMFAKGYFSLYIRSDELSKREREREKRERDRERERQTERERKRERKNEEGILHVCHTTRLNFQIRNRANVLQSKGKLKNMLRTL